MSLKGQPRYVIQAPGHGTEAHWTECDAVNFRSEVCTMKYIRQKTNMPVPRVYGWDTSNHNSLGVPFGVMDFIQGKPAYKIWRWTGKDYDTWDPDTFEVRCRFLKNLASTMAELSKLSFDKIGMLHFERDPDEENAQSQTVGYRFKADGTRMHVVAERESSRNYYSTAINYWVIGNEGVSDSLAAATRGFNRFWSIMSEHIPGVKESAETFVLAHPDSGFQNIMCTDDGKITGIIDWEGVRTVPRCVG